MQGKVMTVLGPIEPSLLWIWSLLPQTAPGSHSCAVLLHLCSIRLAFLPCHVIRSYGFSISVIVRRLGYPYGNRAG